MIIINTKRLLLRTWRPEDVRPYWLINQDQKVLEFLPGPLSLEQIETFIDGANRQQELKGYCLWAVELKETGALLGFVGLQYIDYEARFTPAVEIGWRLCSAYWGSGYASEGALAALEYGFNECGLKKVVSFTVPANLRSQRVMQKIGMQRDFGGNFAHPKLPTDHPLSQHILYRITKAAYLQARSQ